MNLEEFNILEYVLTNPLVFLFALQWGFGHFFKYKINKLNNNLIPCILLCTGMGLGYLIISHDIYGILTGLLVSFVEMGAFVAIKDSLKFVNK